MKTLAAILVPPVVAAWGGCATEPRTPTAVLAQPSPAFYWTALFTTNAPVETNQSRLALLPLPPLLQLPEQKSAREEVEKSGVSPALVQRMLQGQVLALPEIKELAAKNVSETNTVKYLRSTGGIYMLTTKDIDDLRAASVSNGVVDYLLTTPALRGTLYYYPTLYPTYPYRPAYPWWDYHHHHSDYHHDVHHDSHHY